MRTSIYLAILTLSILIGTSAHAEPENAPDTESSSAVFAGGCFWCIESDFEKLEGVISVESGYTGGSAETAKYKIVGKGGTGHYEAVEVIYDSSKVSYSQLLEYFWRHIDPTDPTGQFCDKGESYRSAVFYTSEIEKKTIASSLAVLAIEKPFDAEIVTAIEAAKPFYSAELYHQDYAEKNPIRYNYYRRACGRDARIKELWGTASK